MSHCEFCDNPFEAMADPEDDAANVLLLNHVQSSADCRQQYEFLLENLRSSWTPNMSGG